MQPRLIRQRGDVADRLTAVSQHHRQIGQDLPRIVPSVRAFSTPPRSARVDSSSSGLPKQRQRPRVRPIHRPLVGRYRLAVVRSRRISPACPPPVP